MKGIISTILLVLAAAASAVAQQAAADRQVSSAPASSAVANGVTEIFLARENGAGSYGEPATSFAPRDIPIYCVVQLENGSPVTVKMELFAVSVARVRPGSRVVSTSYTTSERQDLVYFTGRPEGLWVPGKYRVDVSIDGKPAASREFTVVAAVRKEPAAAAPASFGPKPAATGRRPRPARKTL
ncbi:MAG: hypothetical protein ACK4S4_07030 [Pyrinomonadaceae bacterium]